MKVGILTHNYPPTHTERKDAGIFIFDFAKALAKKVDGVYIFCPNLTGLKEDYKETPVTWFRWKGEKSKLGNYKIWNPISIFYFLDFFWRGRKEVIKFIKKNKIDFCLVMWAYPNGVFALEAKRKFGVPYAVWTLGSDIFLYGKFPIVKNLVKKILQEASLCYGGGYEISRRTEKIGGKPCRYLPTATVINASKSKKVELDRKRFNFFYLGRLETVKGPDILLEAVNLLRQKANNFHVYFVGGGSLEELLKKRVNEWELEDEVTIFGRVDDQEIVNGYLKNCDCLVIPSRFDSLSLVFSEGLKTGIPMISSNFGDIPYFVRRYSLGFVFQNENTQDLANCMKKALKIGKSFRKKYSKNMKRLAKMYDINETAKKFIKEVEGVVGSNG